MKNLGTISLLALLTLSAVGCSSAKATRTEDLSTWAKLKAAMNARFTSGQKALQQANDAKAAAKSYKMRVEMRLHPGDPFITVEEMACPDRQRLTASLGDRPMYEAFRIADTSFVKDNNEWVKSPVPPDVYPCGNNPGASAPWALLNEGRDMSSALVQLAGKAHANISVGKLIVANGAPCQEWEISFGHPGSKDQNNNSHMGAMRYTICVDTETHLPNQVVMGTGGIIVKYYDWNQPVNITAPI
jgi:hypothetical protein